MIVGPSTSGKSTMAKFLCQVAQSDADIDTRMIDRDIDESLVIDGGDIISTANINTAACTAIARKQEQANEHIALSSLDSSKPTKYQHGQKRCYLSVYLTPLSYLTYKYDSRTSALDVINGAKTYEHRALLLRIQKALQIPSTERVESMLQSQTKGFEVLFAFRQALDKHALGFLDSLDRERRNSVEGREREKKKTVSVSQVLLVFDEYFDKEAPQVTKAVFEALRRLRRELSSGAGTAKISGGGGIGDGATTIAVVEAAVAVQVVVVSHSRTVVQLGDWAVCLNGGRLFSQGPPDKVILPSQHFFVED